jgi:Do/DeqQ family serine protease
MSLSFKQKIIAPVAVTLSMLTAACIMGGSPESAQAKDNNDSEAHAAPLTLSSEMPSLAPMLKKAMPAVVNISVTMTQQAGQSPLGPFMEDPMFRRFFGIPEGQPRERESNSIGSGVIVDAENGYVVTNHHVVAKASKIKVRLNDDREYDAELIGNDPDTDIALLQIEADNLTALTMTDSDSLEVGDYVVAIGSPFGLRQTVTSGIVSGLSRQTGISEGGYEDFIQTDASINPGNSGGALVNLRGELVGVPSNILSRSGGNIGIGFAIPTNLVKNVMAQLVEFGEVQRGRIGITGQNLTSELAEAFELDSTRGALVTRVLPDSPAEKAGIKSEDIITEFDGRSIRDFAELRNQVGLLRVGDEATLTVVRNGKTRKIKVEVGGADEVAVADGEPLNDRLGGAQVGALSDAAREAGVEFGVSITELAPGSPAARAGLREGDVIIGVNRAPVKSVDEFQKRIRAAEQGQLLLHVRRGPGALFILVP